MARRPVQQQRARPQPHQATRRATNLRLQSNHERRLRKTAGAFGEGVDIRGIIIVGPDTVTKRHGLGRVPEGWVLTDLELTDGAALTTTVYRSGQTTQEITFKYDGAAQTVRFDVRVY